MGWRSGAVVPLVAAAVTLSPSAAVAHPSLIASGPLRAGHPSRLTVIILGDEGAFHAAEITFPVSFHLADAHPLGSALGTATISGPTVRVAGFDLPEGQIGQLYVDGTPSVTGPLEVTVVSHLDDGTDYRYPPLAVQVGGSGTGSWTDKALPAGLIALAGALLGVLHLARRRRRAGRS